MKRQHDHLTPILCSDEEANLLKALAASTTAGIWRTKRAKIILGARAGKSVEQLYDHAARKSVPTKALFVYPLTRRFREVLCREAQP